jgi:hypothetical protein
VSQHHHPLRYRPDFLLNGSPTGVLRESFPRWACTTDLTAPTTQVMTTVAVPLQAGDLISSITFKSGATAADTPTNWWFALYSSASTPALLAQTADQTTTAWAANTAKTVALATAQLITEPGVYYAAFMMKATAVTTLIGRTVALAGASTGSISGQKPLAQTSGSSLTTTAPATVATPTTSALVPYVVLT